MTKQEAIEVLSEMRSGYNCFDDLEKPFYHALSMAIEALRCSEEPNRSDTIYRQDAIDVLSMMQGIVAENGVRKGISMAWQQIKDLPSAQPEQGCDECVFKPFKQFQTERKKGEWIWDDEMKCFLCSECERGWREQPTLNGKPLFEWCPVCGADMRGES